MLNERLHPLADTATEVIYQGENCIVAYGSFLTGGMGVRFEIVVGPTQWGVGFKIADVAGRMNGAAYAAAAKLKGHLADDDTALFNEIDAAADTLAVWTPFSQMAETPQQSKA